MSVDSKLLGMKLKIAFGKGEGSYTISNIDESISYSALYSIGQKLNLLQVPEYNDIYLIAESELVKN